LDLPFHSRTHFELHTRPCCQGRPFARRADLRADARRLVGRSLNGQCRARLSLGRRPRSPKPSTTSSANGSARNLAESQTYRLPPSCRQTSDCATIGASGRTSLEGWRERLSPLRGSEFTGGLQLGASARLPPQAIDGRPLRRSMRVAWHSPSHCVNERPCARGPRSCSNGRPFACGADQRADVMLGKMDVV
jgi:hypothetical protein